MNEIEAKIEVLKQLMNTFTQKAKKHDKEGDTEIACAFGWSAEIVEKKIKKLEKELRK